MPNRILKESICTSENLNRLSPEEEVFFYRLIVNCDDYGRTDARLPILRSRCFPLKLDSIKDKDIECWLNGLIKQDLVQVYSVNGVSYLQISTWNQHQQIRAKRSKYPAPRESNANLQSSASDGNQLLSNVPVIQSESESESGVEIESETETTAEKQILKSLIKLRGWQADEEDVHWLQGLRSEFPGFTPAEFKACLDYYSGKAPPTHKGIWKNRFRNWMIKKQEFERQKPYRRRKQLEKGEAPEELLKD
jgi:hypothetical protein